MAEPLYFETTRHQKGKLLWKVWAHDVPRAEASESPWLGWGLRRVLEHFGEKFDDGVGSWLRRNSARLNEYVKPAGLSGQQCIVPNLASAQSRGRSPEPCARQEFQLTTGGLLCLAIGFWCRKRLVAREMAGAVLRSLILTLAENSDGDISPETFSGFAIHLIPSSAQHCPLREDCLSELCLHAGEFLKVGADCENAAESYFQMLRFAYNKNFDCPAMAAVVELQVKILGRFLMDAVAQKGSGDSLSFCLGDLMLENRRQKRRRVDEDLQAALLHTAIQTKRAKTVGGLARSTGVLGPSTVETWVPKHMGVYRSPLAMEFQSSSAVAVCFDAARFGQPKEDIVSFVLSNLDIGGSAGHLAPQPGIVRLEAGAGADGQVARPASEPSICGVSAGRHGYRTQTGPVGGRPPSRPSPDGEATLGDFLGLYAGRIVLRVGAKTSGTACH